jgi:hypothetical protein
LTLWWSALHALLLGAIIGLGIPYPVKIALATVLGAHALVRWPQSAVQRVTRDSAGLWGLPDRGLVGLSLGRGTGYTPLWVRLVLTGGGETIDILLLKDQLDQISWRVLQTRLRSAALG